MYMYHSKDPFTNKVRNICAPERHTLPLLVNMDHALHDCNSGAQVYSQDHCQQLYSVISLLHCNTISARVGKLIAKDTVLTRATATP